MEWFLYDRDLRHERVKIKTPQVFLFQEFTRMLLLNYFIRI